MKNQIEKYTVTEEWQAACDTNQVFQRNLSLKKRDGTETFNLTVMKKIWTALLGKYDTQLKKDEGLSNSAAKTCCLNQITIIHTRLIQGGA